MLELKAQTLEFHFPEVHPEARCTVRFMRTLRIPDTGRAYPLPPGLGSFPMVHVDDHASRLPEAWVKQGGILLPMYQGEALWIDFSSSYPCSIKVAAGKVNALTGEPWSNHLNQDPQDYLVVPEQPWIDGFHVDAGHIRQFVAMPLGEGHTAEEQLTGNAEFGGVQLMVYPMKREHYDDIQSGDRYFRKIYMKQSMGLAPGGLIRQEIYEDEHGISCWDQRHGSRCFVHILNSRQWQEATGTTPPGKPISAEEYSKAGLPWFDYYAENLSPLPGSRVLAGMKSVNASIRSDKSNIQLYNSEEKDWLSSLIKGEKGLAITYWLYFFLIGNALRLSAWIIFHIAPSIGHTVTFFTYIYQVLAGIAVWRASNKYQGKKIWPVIAKIVIVIAFIAIASDILRHTRELIEHSPSQTSTWRQDAASAAAADAAMAAAEAQAIADQNAINQNTPPKFSAFPAQSVYRGRNAQPIIRSEFDKAFMTRILDTEHQPVNFSGEYVLSAWGCGTNCLMGVAVNARTGNVVALPGSICCWDGDGEKLIYRQDSRLIVMTGLINEEGTHGAHFYELRGDEFTHTLTIPVAQQYSSK